MIVPARAVRFSGSRLNSRGLRVRWGMGEICDPRDTPCVLRNAAASAARNQAAGEVLSDELYQGCINNGTDPAECGDRWPVGYSGGIPATLLDAGQLSEAMMTPQQAGNAYLAVLNAETPAPVSSPMTPKPGTKASATPGGSLITTSSGAQTDAPATGGFDLTSIPWYLWAGAAGLAFFAMRENRG